MKKITRIAGLAAFAVVGLAASASGASAYSYSTHFTGTNVGAHVMTASGVPVSCSGASYSGNSPVSGATVQFHPTYSGCTATLAGVPFSATITAASDWAATPLAGVGPFTGSISILAAPSGNALTIAVPAVGCAVYANAQTLSTLTMTNVAPTNVRISANVSNISYTQNGMCPGIPATGGTTASYTGIVEIPNVTINN